MEDNVIDTLRIEVTGDSSKAVSGIDKLISTLERIKSVTGGSNKGLSAIKRNLESISNAADKINSDSISKIDKLSESMKGLSAISEIKISRTIADRILDIGAAIDSLKDVDFSKLTEMADALSILGGVKNVKIPNFSRSDVASATLSNATSNPIEMDVNPILSSLEKVKESAVETTDEIGEMSNATSTATSTPINIDAFIETKSELDILQMKIDATKDKLKELLTVSEKSDTSEIANLLSTIKRLEEELKNFGKKGKGISNKIANSFTMITKRAGYRAINAAISAVTNSFKEGVKAVYQYSKTMDGRLAKSLDAITTSTKYLKNSVGAAVAPIVQSLSPTIIRISDGLADIGNSIGMVSAALAGQTSFIKAKKYAQEYAETIEDVKRSTLGIDEINILGNNATSQNDTSQMFETVDISGWDVAGAIAKITALVVSIGAIVSALKGVKITEAFVGMGKGLKTAYNSIKNTAKWQKVVTVIAAIAVEATAVGTAVYDMASGNKSVASGLIEIGIVGTAAFFAISAAFNSTGIGLIITLVVAGIASIVGGLTAVSEKSKDRELQKFWQVSGVAIEDSTIALDNYFRALGIDKQQEWNETLENANNDLIDANFNYNTLWASIKGDNISTNKIQQLGEAFQNLANAATAVNDAAIGSLMASIKTGIEMNITPELTEKLGGLLNQLEAAQDVLNIKIQGLSAEYQSLLNDIKNNGGKVTSEQRAKLEELRAEMDTYTLSGNTASTLWSMSLQETMNAGINAGLNKDDVKSALDDLVTERKDYLDILKDNYASSKTTLTQLIEIDKTQYGGALGFSDADLVALNESYNAQLEEVNKQFNDVIQGVYNGLAANAMSSDPGSFWKDISAWIWNWDYYGEKDAYKEEQEILEMIEKYFGSVDHLKVEIPAHASGGFPEDGLFFANHSELVGKFSNGKTAVANNEQIISGIKQGVKEAMQETQGSDGDIIIQIVDSTGKIKSQEYIKSSQMANRRSGKTVIPLGV